MEFNVTEIAKKLSEITKDNIRFDENENKFIGFMDESEISSDGINLFIESNQPFNHTLNLSTEALEYILEVIKLLRYRKSISSSLYKLKLIGKSYKEKCEVVRKFMKEFYNLDIPQKYGTAIQNHIFWINEHDEDDLKESGCSVGYMIGYTDEYLHDNPEREYYGGSFGFSSFDNLIDKIIEYKTLDEFMSHGADYIRHA